jgi:hypothetical protein
MQKKLCKQWMESKENISEKNSFFEYMFLLDQLIILVLVFHLHVNVQ